MAGRGVRERVGRVAGVVLSVGALAGLGFMVHELSRDGDAVVAEHAARLCGTPVADPGDCVAEATASVTSKAANINRQPDRIFVDLAGQDVRIDFAHGSSFLDHVHAGDRVTVDSWRGDVVAVVDGGVTGRTQDDPAEAYRRDKGEIVFLAGLAMFLVPATLISVVEGLGDRSSGRFLLPALLTFLPLAGIVLMVAASSLADGMNATGNVAVAGTCLALIAWFAGWIGIRSRRGARRSRSDAAIEAARRFSRGR